MFENLWYRIKEFFLSLSLSTKEDAFPCCEKEDDIDWDEFDSDWNTVPEVNNVTELDQLPTAHTKKKAKKSKKKAKKITKKQLLQEVPDWMVEKDEEDWYVEYDTKPKKAKKKATKKRK